MGEQRVSEEATAEAMRAFMKAVLDDIAALERMLEGQRFETDVRRIGAEQEVFLIDAAGGPMPRADEVLESVHDDRVVTELAKFNLEINLTPREFGGTCLRDLEAELQDVLAKVRTAARRRGLDVLLCGILPTLRKSDLTLENMTDRPRYHALNKAMHRMRGNDFHVFINGVDQLDVTHDNVMLEACNTSFQIHFQVAPDEFAFLYNHAQAMTAPVLAAAVNSPLLLGRRLWQETRVALFEHSVDTRNAAHKGRMTRPRVSFGDRWIDDSVLEIFRDDVARFRGILSQPRKENSLEVLRDGGIPGLAALRLHNGTVYRWNRACYGVHEGKPHLRIENRVLPAGPSVIDEIANSAFYFGLMTAGGDAFGTVSEQMAFDDAKKNFFAAARFGLDANVTWLDGKTYPVTDLILKELLPVARKALKDRGLDGQDVDRYLDVLGERVERHTSGSLWALNSVAKMGEAGVPREARYRALVRTALEHQSTDMPLHEWPLAVCAETTLDLRENYLTVGQFMRTELVTVDPEDSVDLAASVMDWEKLRYVPVEDSEGQLVGLLTHRGLLRLLANRSPGDAPVPVRDIMKRPLTVTPETTTLDSIALMRSNRLGCLPVVEEGRLVGMVTGQDLIDVSARLLETYLKGD